VYQVAETYPKFVRFFLPSSQVKRSSDKRTVVDVHAKLLGFLPTRWIGKGKKRNYRYIHFRQTHGLFKGLSAIWKFRNRNEKTLVTIYTTFKKPKLGYLFELLLGKLIVEQTTAKILRELKSAAESK
jgi:ribosome-associated toxin RatA of RatAB toxin-antitoxin module